MNATVTLSLGEIDALRNQVAEAQTKLAESESRNRSIQVEVSENTSTRVLEHWKGQYGYPEEHYTNQTKTVTSWKNLDEVMGLLEEKASQKREEYLQTLRDTIGHKEAALATQREMIDGKSEEIRVLNNKIRELQKIEVESTQIESLKKEVLEKAGLIGNYLFEIAGLQAKLSKRSLWSRLFD